MAVDLDLAKKRFKLCQDTDAEQRIAEVADLEFQDPDKQWDEAAKQERRVLRAIKQGGANKTTLLKMGLTERRINEIVTKYGVAIPRGQGGKRL